MMSLYKFTQAGQEEGRVFFRDELVSHFMDVRPSGVLFEDDGYSEEPVWKKVGDVRKGKISFTSTNSLFD